jgi:hypothetical protein
MKDELENVIKLGDIDKLTLLFNNDYAFTAHTFEIAVKHNQFEIIKFLHEELCPYNDKLYIIAIKNNRLDTIELLRKLNYNFNKETFEYAVKHDNITMMMYLYDNGCPFDLIKCIELAKNNKCFDYLNNIKQQRVNNGYKY